MSSLLDLIEQAELDICASRHKGNAQSAAAFESIKPTLTARRKEVLEVVRRLETATGEEVADAMGVQVNVISGRLSDLKREGFIVPTGITRKTRGGNSAMSLRVAEGK